MNRIEVEPDGPPLPPPVRRRRRRRRVTLVVLVVGLLLAALVVGLVRTIPTVGELAPPSGTASDPPSPSSPPSEGAVEPPDPERFEGTDAVFARLLLEVETSEQVMIGVQRDLEEVFADPDPATSLEMVREVAERAEDDLLDVRRRLEETLDDPGPEAVRGAYLQHLDAWRRYLGAVAEDPALIADETASAPYDVEINATADEFARTLERDLPASAPKAIRDFAEAILDRGFRSSGGAEV